MCSHIFTLFTIILLKTCFFGHARLDTCSFKLFASLPANAGSYEINSCLFMKLTQLSRPRDKLQGITVAPIPIAIVRADISRALITTSERFPQFVLIVERF